MRRHAALLVLLAIALSIVLALWSAAAPAAPPAGAMPDPALQEFYGGLKDRAGHSCCSIADCRPVDARTVKDDTGGHWEALVGEGHDIAPPRWVAIPADKILPPRPNPEGRGVLCYSKARAEVHCFLPPLEI